MGGVVPDVVVVAVGGGGLLCGVVQGMHKVDWKVGEREREGIPFCL